MQITLNEDYSSVDVFDLENVSHERINGPALEHASPFILCTSQVMMLVIMYHSRLLTRMTGLL